MSRRVIRLTEVDLNKIIKESIYSILDMDKNFPIILSYIKGFGEKGKLPSCDKKFSDYFVPYLEQAYEWACEKVDGIRRDGFAYFKHLFYNYVISKFTLNKRGLIYVERSIDFKLGDNFELLGYSSIGECWSWKKLNSRSYCSNFGINDSTVNVVLCGYVHPDSVDWLETVYLNSYDMKNETEIRMNDNAYVEVSYVKINGTKVSLGGSYLLNASTDKYKK